MSALDLGLAHPLDVHELGESEGVEAGLGTEVTLEALGSHDLWRRSTLCYCSRCMIREKERERERERERASERAVGGKGDAAIRANGSDLDISALIALDGLLEETVWNPPTADTPNACTSWLSLFALALSFCAILSSEIYICPHARGARRRARRRRSRVSCRDSNTQRLDGAFLATFFAISSDNDGDDDGPSKGIQLGILCAAPNQSRSVTKCGVS